MIKHVITNDVSLRDALQQMNDRRVKFLVVTDSDSKVIGTLTDGDVRRSILRGTDLSSSVEESVCRNITYLKDTDGLSEAVEAFKDEKFAFLPVMDAEGHLINIITRRNLNVLLLKDIMFSTDFDFASLDDIVLESVYAALQMQQLVGVAQQLCLPCKCYALCENCRKRGTAYSHVEYKYENRGEYGIHRYGHYGRGHGLLWVSR